MHPGKELGQRLTNNGRVRQGPGVTCSSVTNICRVARESEINALSSTSIGRQTHGHSNWEVVVAMRQGWEVLVPSSRPRVS